jgi:hypothetical protein
VGEYLDNTIIFTAQEAGIDAMDERYAFLGHQLCSSDHWVFSPTDTTVTDTSSAFHPTAAGLSQMAGDLGAYWSALQAGSAPTIWPQSVTAPVNGWLPLNLPYGIPTTAQAEAMLASLSNISAYAGDYNASASYWNFTTRNGCTTRDRVLQDEALTTTQWSAAQPLTPPDGGCPVQYGSWETPYDVDATSPTTPQRVTYNASNNNLSTGLQIDHIVPKSNAWETGAADWEEDYGDAQGGQMLTDFTNDRGGPELLAVSAASNGSKGNSPPEIWMPANPGMTCAYAKMWIAVKWEWNLEVGTIADGINGNEPTERIFLQDTLNGC